MNAINSFSGSSLPMAENPGKIEPVGKSSLDRADFMKLFITQLQYQDPMEPMDSYEMASQLAQFSNMEATMKMSANMEKLLDYQMSQNNLQLLSLIGKSIETSGNEIGVSDGNPATTSYILDESAPFCMIYIYSPTGQLIRTFDMGYTPAGHHNLSWDGLDNDGNQVPDGLYTYQIDALSAEGGQVGIERRASGKVTGVAFDSGQATITIAGHVQKRVGDIIRVNDSNTAAKPAPQTNNNPDASGSGGADMPSLEDLFSGL